MWNIHSPYYRSSLLQCFLSSLNGGLAISGCTETFICRQVGHLVGPHCWETGPSSLMPFSLETLESSSGLCSRISQHLGSSPTPCACASASLASLKSSGCANGGVVLFVWEFLPSLPSSPTSLSLKAVLCLLDLVPHVFYSLPFVLSVSFSTSF